MTGAPPCKPYGIVRFAPHALIDPWNPELSGIVRSLYDRQGRPVDGFLRVADICPADVIACRDDGDPGGESAHRSAKQAGVAGAGLREMVGGLGSAKRLVDR